jgi:GRASP55/65 PDZ-like domain
MGPKTSEQIQTNSFRVMLVQPNSPAETACLEPMLDFIVTDNLIEFESSLKANIDKPVKITVYNMYSRKIRTIEITPRLNWGGNGILGAVIKPDDYCHAHERAFQVRSIYVDSPSHKAGLKSMDDFILGTEDNIFDSLHSFQDFLKLSENKEIEILVFNKLTEKLNKHKITPSSKWDKGNEDLGLLGSVLGCGFEFPMKQEETKEVVLDKESSDIKLNNQPINEIADKLPEKSKEIGVSEDDISITPQLPPA